VLSRRVVLRGLALAAAGAVVLPTYALGIEPRFRLVVTRYDLSPPGWPPGLDLTVAVLADIHAGEPYMPLARVEHIVETTNALRPDLTLLLGDYGAAHRFVTRPVPLRECAAALAGLTAPLGVLSVLGNHDWWDDRKAQRLRRGPTEARLALEAAAIPVLENDAVRLDKEGRPFWILGLGDQVAFRLGRGRFRGVDDLPRTLAKLSDDAPAILMAHEPDIFAETPARVSLTLSGHTHGGQVRLFGYSPVVPSAFGNRYAYGHIVEEGRHLVVSGGLGVSMLPVRFGVPPEIVLLRLRAGHPQT